VMDSRRQCGPRATGQVAWVVSMSVESERGVSAHATDAAKLCGGDDQTPSVSDEDGDVSSRANMVGVHRGLDGTVGLAKADGT
jgi:hypothetical protein